MKNKFKLLRDLSPLEQEIMDYLSNHPGRTAEDVIVEKAGYEQDPESVEKRRRVARAIGYLMAQRYIDWDVENGGLLVSDCPPQG